MSPKTDNVAADNSDDGFECLDEACIFKVKKSPEEKVDDLKNAIKELGYTIEDTEEGIRIKE